MPGEVELVRLGERRRREQAGDPAAARRVGLEAVDDRPRAARKSAGVEAYSPAAIVHAGGRALAERAAARRGRRELTGSSNQVTPRGGEALGEAERLLRRERAVRVDEQLGVVADRVAGRRGRDAGRGRARGRP